MDFKELCFKTAILATEKNRVAYLYRKDNGELDISYVFSKDWLFQAYPGGRKILSIEGAELLNRDAELPDAPACGDGQFDPQEIERTTDV